jgi:hypothetical protein
LWERVRGVLDGRNANKAKRGKHNFAFSGLIACAKCGCSVVGEIKKQRYVYYHCTGYADKCQGDPASCRRRHVREEALEQRFTKLLGQLRFDNDVLEWVRESLQASHTDERREHEEAVRRLQAEHKRLGDRINAMYLDKLDGRVDGAFFDKMSAQWREEQNRCLREIAWHESAEQSYMDEGVQILELAQNAQKLFERQEPREKRRLLNFVVSNCTWEDGEVVATFRQPFDLLAETTAISMRFAADNKSNSAKSEIWLGRQDSKLCIPNDRIELEGFRRRSLGSACGESPHSGFDAQPCGGTERLFSRSTTKLPGPQRFEITAGLAERTGFLR